MLVVVRVLRVWRAPHPRLCLSTAGGVELSDLVAAGGSDLPSIFVTVIPSAGVSVAYALLPLCPRTLVLSCIAPLICQPCASAAPALDATAICKCVSPAASGRLSTEPAPSIAPCSHRQSGCRPPRPHISAFFLALHNARLSRCFHLDQKPELTSIASKVIHIQTTNQTTR